MTIQYMAKTINIVRTIILTMKGSASARGKEKRPQEMQVEKSHPGHNGHPPARWLFLTFETCG
jgi:hypothetical protein